MAFLKSPLSKTLSVLAISSIALLSLADAVKAATHGKLDGYCIVQPLVGVDQTKCCATTFKSRWRRAKRQDLAMIRAERSWSTRALIRHGREARLWSLAENKKFEKKNGLGKWKKVRAVGTACTFRIGNP